MPKHDKNNPTRSRFSAVCVALSTILKVFVAVVTLAKMIIGFFN